MSNHNEYTRNFISDYFSLHDIFFLIWETFGWDGY